MKNLAEEILNVDKKAIFETVSNITGVVSIIFWVLIAGAIIAGILIWIAYMRSFKHKIRVRVVTSDRKYIVDDRFRIMKDEEGIQWWQLRNRKHKIPIAPAEAIEISAGGIMCVEAYFTQEGEYVFPADNISGKNISGTAGAVYTEQKAAPTKKSPFAFLFPQRQEAPHGKYIYMRDGNKTIDSFQPLTTKQRLILVNQYKKAYARKQNKFLENLPQIASIAAVVIILLMVFMFWEDITKPSLKAQESMAGIAKTQERITEQLADIILERQRVASADSTRGQLGGDAP